MSEPTYEKVALTTDSSGDATDYTNRFSGRVLAIRYAKTDFADGVDFTITTDDAGAGLWTESDVNAAKTVYPTLLVQDQVGANTTQRDYCWCFRDDRVKIVIANGGDTKSGTFFVYHD